MTECEHCKLMEDKSMVIFEDEDLVAVLSNKPAAKGHVLVLPRQHLAIFEQVPDNIVQKMAVVANRISTSLFELLRLNGTNILIENGTAAGQSIPHCAVQIIPRTENDGMKLSWNPKKFAESQMAEAEALLIRELKPKEQKVETQKKSEVLADPENYLNKQLRRIP
jgi:histidine triad (HIT) family protein